MDEIREIRANIYATAMDYSVDALITQTFFKTVQNKLHFAIHGKTAVELIIERVIYHKVTTFTDGQVDIIRNKCLFLVGETDPFMTLGGKEMLNSYNMQAKFFNKVGHGINHEIPDEINSIFKDYFKDKITV